MFQILCTVCVYVGKEIKWVKNKGKKKPKRKSFTTYTELAQSPEAQIV